MSPASPSATSKLTVTWKADRAYKPGALRFRVTTASGKGCSSDVTRRVAGAVRAGQTVRVTLAPRRRWCATGALTLTLRTPQEVFSTLRLLLKGVPLGTPAKVTLLDGSTVTTQVPGRPDRSAALSGVLRGFVPGVIKLGTDIQLTLSKAALQLQAPPADALCTAAGAFPQVLPLKGNATLVLLQSGDATLSLPLAVAPPSLTGCAGDGAGAAQTTFTLAGKSGPGGLSRLALAGSLPNVGLAGGTSATLAAALTVSVDLSGKG